MIDEVLWDKLERAMLNNMERFEPQNVPVLAVFFEELRDNTYSLWLVPKVGYGGFQLIRGKSWLTISFYHPGRLNIQSNINGKHRRFLAQPIALTTELRALLDLLIAQPEEEGKA